MGDDHDVVERVRMKTFKMTLQRIDRARHAVVDVATTLPARPPIEEASDLVLLRPACFHLCRVLEHPKLLLAKTWLLSDKRLFRAEPAALEYILKCLEGALERRDDECHTLVANELLDPLSRGARLLNSFRCELHFGVWLRRENCVVRGVRL